MSSSNWKMTRLWSELRASMEASRYSNFTFLSIATNFVYGSVEVKFWVVLEISIVDWGVGYEVESVGDF